MPLFCRPAGVARNAKYRRGGNTRFLRRQQQHLSREIDRASIGAFCRYIRHFAYPVMQTGNRDDFITFQTQRLSVLAIDKLQWQYAHADHRLERWIRSKLSAITAFTPSNMVPFASPSRVKNRCRILCLPSRPTELCRHGIEWQHHKSPVFRHLGNGWCCRLLRHPASDS